MVSWSGPLSQYAPPGINKRSVQGLPLRNPVRRVYCDANAVPMPPAESFRPPFRLGDRVPRADLERSSSPTLSPAVQIIKTAMSTGATREPGTGRGPVLGRLGNGDPDCFVPR